MPSDFSPIGNAHAIGVALGVFYTGDIIDYSLFNRAILVSVEDIKLATATIEPGHLCNPSRAVALKAFWDGLVDSMSDSLGTLDRNYGRQNIIDAAHRAYFFDALERKNGARV